MLSIVLCYLYLVLVDDPHWGFVLALAVPMDVTWNVRSVVHMVATAWTMCVALESVYASALLGIFLGLYVTCRGPLLLLVEILLVEQFFVITLTK